MIHFYELASRDSTQRARLLRRAEIQIDDLFACYACQDCRCSSKKPPLPEAPIAAGCFLTATLWTWGFFATQRTQLAFPEGQIIQAKSAIRRTASVRHFLNQQRAVNAKYTYVKRSLRSSVPYPEEEPTTMEHETQPASLRRQVLIAAAPNDPQAIGLVKELRLLGLSTTLAETVGLASLADEVAVCIIVLRPVTWRTTPSITTAMRCNPRYMIPLLAEPMLLPSGSWASEPISIKESVAETAQELETLITGYMQTVPEPESAIVEQPSTNGPLTCSTASFVRPPISRKTRSWKNMRYLLLAFVLLLGVGLLIRYAPHSLTSISTLAPIQATTTNNALLDHPYTAAVPGPGCDAGGANWQTGLYYKAPVTPTASTATTPVQGTPTLQVITDNSIVTTCQQHGLLVKHTAHFDVFANIFFDSDGLALPRHFSTQITATVVAASDTASFALGVRNQGGAPTTSGPNNGYGDDTLTIGVNGSWEAMRVNDTTGAADARFTRGFVTPAKTFTLAAEVDGPLMTFSINGQNVTTVVDTTYPSSYGIDFGIGDPGAKSAPSALFSHFVYTPLPDTHLTATAIVATATAQAAKDDQAAYLAPVPGFGCDKGAGQWKPASQAQDYVTTRCLPNGLTVSQGASARYAGRVSFYWLNGNFPANYKVKAQIDVSGLNGGCAGVVTRTNEQAGGYVFLVCSDGTWQIEIIDSNGNGHQLAQGQVTQRSSYSMEATSNGPIQSLTLEGAQVASVSDKTYTTTDDIELTLSPLQGSAGTAVFSNFVFMPLP